MARVTNRQKAAAFDILMDVLEGKHRHIRSYQREAAEQPHPDKCVIETVTVYEWVLHDHVVGQPNLTKQLLAEAKRKIAR